MPQLTLPQLDEFRVIGNSQSLQTSIINGAMSTTAYIYLSIAAGPDRKFGDTRL